MMKAEEKELLENAHTRKESLNQLLWPVQYAVVEMLYGLEKIQAKETIEVDRLIKEIETLCNVYVPSSRAIAESKHKTVGDTETLSEEIPWGRPSRT
jgi:hypothetical protein